MNTASQQPDNPADLQTGPLEGSTTGASAPTTGPADDNEPLNRLAHTPGSRFLAHLVKAAKQLFLNGQVVNASVEEIWARFPEKDRQNYDTAASAFSEEECRSLRAELENREGQITRLEEDFHSIARAVGPAAYNREGNPTHIWRIVQAATGELDALKDYRTSINWLIGELAGEKNGLPAAEPNGRASAASVAAWVRGLVRELEFDVEGFRAILNHKQQRLEDAEKEKENLAAEARQEVERLIRCNGELADRLERTNAEQVRTQVQLSEANREIEILRAQLEQHQKPAEPNPDTFPHPKHAATATKPKRARKPKSPSA